MRRLLLLLPLLVLGCAKAEEAPATDITAKVPDANGKPPPPMPGSMGKDGRPVGAAPEDAAPKGG